MYLFIVCRLLGVAFEGWRGVRIWRGLGFSLSLIWRVDVELVVFDQAGLGFEVNLGVG